MFYDRYIELCAQIGKSPTAVALEIGLSKATPTKWKKSGGTPQGENLKKIAAYFGITESELLGEEKIQLNNREDDFDNHIELREELRNNYAFRILWETLKDASEADMLEAAANIARRKEERNLK